MFRRANRHLQGIVHCCKIHLGIHMWLQGPVSLTFNVILTYGRPSVSYTNDRPPEDDDFFVETYVVAYISFNVHYSSST
jgi:hypothetical protein